MSSDVQAADLAAFLRDVSESTTRHQRTVADQTKDGFVFWCHAAADLEGVRSPYLEQPRSAVTTFLEVARPGNEPSRPRPGPDGLVDQEELQRYNEARRRWQQHKELYDALFAARTPPDAMELIVATGLLAGTTEQGEIRRHLAAAAAEVTLDRNAGVLRVELSDAAIQEINWTPGEIRTRLVEQGGGLRELVEAQSQSEVEASVQSLVSSFGTRGSTLGEPMAAVRPGAVGIGAFPAVLLRRRDASALLQLLRDMADDMASGGFVSDPFKMLLSPNFRPPVRKVQNDRAALPLPANIEQRQMIDQARTDVHMVIQGPPGTGKTHTIANLAAVLMAEGRRVLVTAENERALTEVQSKLPVSMRPLLLPMLRERGTGALQASVNALTSRAGAANAKDDREHEIEQRMARLLDIEARIAKAERQLAEVARADSAERTFGRTTMTVAGHLQVLAGEQDRLALVDRFLGADGRASAADASSILELTPVVDDAHQQMRQFQFPDDLMSPGELSVWLQEHRGQLAVLGDPGEYDYSELAGRVEDLARLATLLQELPATAWSEITRTPEDYATAAEACRAAAPAVDHGVTVEPSTARPAAIRILEAYLALDAERFDQPIDDLIALHERARSHVNEAPTSGEFIDPRRADELTRACESALELLRRDRSLLLVEHVCDHRREGRSAIDALVEEAEDLLPGARARLGLPVEVSEAAPPAHELLRQAEGLKAHLESGGKLNKVFGRPRPVKEAAELLQHVRVGGSPIDTVEEAARAVEFFTHSKTLSLIDAWAEQHHLRQPPGLSHHEWLTAICALPSASQQVQAALALADELVSFPFGSAPEGPVDTLRTALATVSQEVVSSLDALAAVAAQQDAEVRIAGVPIRTRAEAMQALTSLRACELRENQHQLLPETWSERCNPLDVDDDVLADMLRVCAAAAAVPSKARTAELTPSAVNRIAERSQIDARRNHLRDEHERVIGGLRRRLAGCVPMSPATRALDEALVAENPTDYRVAAEELDRERQMADRASRLERARSRVAEVHPGLVAAFDTGDEAAAFTLEALEELQDLRDYRATVERWKDEIGSSEQIHRELAELHRDLRRAEQEVAGLRCWSSAIDRLQSRRELRSALSALTIAMDRVPKTRTAKTYPARMRALRAATKDAAPAIPCWIMAIDRVAEVLGYPRGEDRFDVVIVDEASQAWFPAMFLYAIADQVIVVGDDLQTSPSQVVNEAEIRSIVNEHIAGHRLADQVGADLSLYDVAAVMTGPDTMVDHFRCVPEIIDLSNRLSYEPKGKRLLPSRVREPGALDPVKHVQVRGSRRGAGANEPEVAAIVDQAVRCHADPAYAGMDFGVVVVGTTPNAHLKALVTRLLEELGPTAMEERNLEIGTPAQFQGAERNVMFMSLLDVPPEGGRLRKWPHEHTGAARRRVQQLNVAVSRARDQLWIFRSFDLRALAPDDARTVILQSVTPELPSLEQQLEACDSQFERDVVTALAAADPTLTIRTQVEAIGYLIDIVVEDEHGHRLAVECDGDRWHTTEDRVRSDLYRQRTLEDIGWRFERFLASEWYDDPDHRINKILEHLRSLPRTDRTHHTATTTAPADSPSNLVADDHFFDVDDDDTRELDEDAGPHVWGGSEQMSLPTEHGGDSELDWPVEDVEAPSAPSEIFSLPPQLPASARPGLGRPTPGMSDKQSNQLLAQAMRDRGVEPSGRAWIWAKQLLSAGATFAEAAAKSAVAVTDQVADNRETLVCKECGSTWTREVVRGRKPRTCLDCRDSIR